jgi:hypothetical protein
MVVAGGVAGPHVVRSAVIDVDIGDIVVGIISRYAVQRIGNGGGDDPWSVRCWGLVPHALITTPVQRVGSTKDGEGTIFSPGHVAARNGDETWLAIVGHGDGGRARNFCGLGHLRIQRRLPRFLGATDVNPHMGPARVGRDGSEACG